VKEADKRRRGKRKRGEEGGNIGREGESGMKEAEKRRGS
jgi:hypothetical protein